MPYASESEIQHLRERVAEQATEAEPDPLLAKLKQLGELRDSGVLTEAEFEAQKSRILTEQ